MVIAPSGRRRVMEAQTLTDPTTQVDGRFNDAPLNFDGVNNVSLLDEQNPEMNAQNLENAQDQLESMPEVDESAVDGDLTKFVADRVSKQLGFQPRQVKKYESKISQTSIDPEGNETVDVTLPNKDVRGRKISKDGFLKPLIKDIQRRFKLHFDGAQESEENWTVKFTTVAPAPEGMTDPSEDALEKAYGPAEKSDDFNEQNNMVKRRAFTINEMIKGHKNNLVDSLLRLLGKKVTQ